MELRQLRNFYEAAKLENMTRASLKLNISQPALSISISRLEDELNVKLFIRNGRIVKLSEEGKEILPVVEKFLILEEELKDKCRNFDATDSMLRLELSAAQPFFNDIISKFNCDHPNIEVIVNNKSELPDFIVYCSHKFPKEHTLSNADESGCLFRNKDEIVYREDLVVTIPRILLPVHDPTITMDFIEENSLIGLNRDFSLSSIEDYYFSKHKLNLKHSIICDSQSVMKKLLINGTGIAFTPSKTWLTQNNPALTMVPFEIPNWHVFTIIKATHNRNNAKASRLFLNYIEEAFSKL